MVKPADAIFHLPSSIFPIMDRDRVLGALLGAAVGDALGMPVDGLSHQNVRLYYKGIKGYRDDEKRLDLRSGQWTIHTQRIFAYARVLTRYAPTLSFAADGWDWEIEDGLFLELAQERRLRRAEHEGDRYDTVTAVVAAVPFGVWGAARGADPEALAGFTFGVMNANFSHTALRAAMGMAEAVRLALGAGSPPLDGGAGRGAYDAVRFMGGVVDVVASAEEENEPFTPISNRLRDLVFHLDEYPLDLQDRCNGTGDVVDEAFPFAVAMAARGPDRVEATLLSAVNVGGAASAVGAMTGALLGAFNGWSAFPAAWREGLEDAERLEIEAHRLADALGIA